MNVKGNYTDRPISALQPIPVKPCGMGEYSSLDGNGPARMKPTTDHVLVWHSLNRDGKRYAMTTLTVIQKTK